MKERKSLSLITDSEKILLCCSSVFLINKVLSKINMLKFVFILSKILERLCEKISRQFS